MAARRLPRERGLFAVVAAVGLVLALLAGYGLLRGAGSTGNVEERAGDGDEPASAAVQEISVRVIGAGRLRLGATLLLPGPTDAPVPAAAVIPGFGPTNRDGVASPGTAPDTLYRDLAETLGEAGVATLRYDKRGQGTSVLPAGIPLRFEDMVEDARGALDLLAGRKGIDGRRLALVGHDEGGLVALRLAADDPRVRAVVLISTPGRPLAEVLADDLRATA
ncbi:MAG: lysophospholipase, partial [Actinomycetota bacterium]|nr:lysophospholipase [Actinomycetota bacterium]